jgi:hypothetical protein
LERRGCAERFAACVQACGAALAASPHRIDYRTREVAFAEPLVLEPSLLEAACVQSRVRPMRQVLLASSLWIWGELTGASPRLAPGANRVDTYGRFSRLVLPRLEARLRDVARRVLDASSVRDRNLGLAVEQGETICRRMNLLA